MDKKPHIYILSAAALGPNKDINHDSRKALTTDAISADLQNILKTFTNQDLRRIGHFTELSLLGSQTTLSRLSKPLIPETAVYFSTGLGEVQKTVSLFQQALDADAGFASPYNFVSSVSSTTAFYVAKIAGFKSRNITVCQEELSFEMAFKLAQMDIEEGETEYALLGGTDECFHPRSEHMRRIQLNEEQIMGEGSGWLYLGKNSQNAIGELLIVKEMSALESGDTLSDWLKTIENTLLPWMKKGEKTYLLPGFRLDKTDMEGLLNRLSDIEIKNYLDYCGCFHTAAAFGIASVFDQPHFEPALYFHVNRNLYGRTMVVGIRVFSPLNYHSE